MSLRSLLAGDDWLRKAPNEEQVLLGYAQSWALFRMLMEQQPRALRDYLVRLYDRRTAEHRLEDWMANFGSNLAEQKRLYQNYVRILVQREVRPARH
jgi:hypothetical protein